uniref:Uncharacterized protein n=1 Tax=Arundo donax TaxID=35708 RepID=A0A0A9DZZ1_ARUDO
MVGNLCCWCICPLKCRFRDKGSMVDAPTILLSSKAEVHTQPISPFPLRLRRRWLPALGQDNCSSGCIHSVHTVVNRPHLTPTLHLATRMQAHDCFHYKDPITPKRSKLLCPKKHDSSCLMDEPPEPGSLPPDPRDQMSLAY